MIHAIKTFKNKIQYDIAATKDEIVKFLNNNYKNAKSFIKSSNKENLNQQKQFCNYKTYKNRDIYDYFSFKECKNINIKTTPSTINVQKFNNNTLTKENTIIKNFLTITNCYNYKKYIADQNYFIDNTFLRKFYNDNYFIENNEFTSIFNYFNDIKSTYSNINIINSSNENFNDRTFEIKPNNLQEQETKDKTFMFKFIVIIIFFFCLITLYAKLRKIYKYKIKKKFISYK